MKKQIRNWSLLTAMLVSIIAATIVCVLFDLSAKEEVKQRLSTVAVFMAGYLETGKVDPATVKKSIDNQAFRFIIFSRFQNNVFVPIPGAAFPENYARYLPQSDDPVIHFEHSDALPEYMNTAIAKDKILAIIVPMQFKGSNAFCIIGAPVPKVPADKYIYIMLLCLLPLTAVLLYLSIVGGETKTAPAKVETPKVPAKPQSSNEQVLQLGRLTALRQVISGIIHELNQPLCIQKGYLGLMQMIAEQKENKTEDDDSMLKYLDICMQNIDRTSSILDHIRRFVKDGARDNAVIEINPVINTLTEFFGEQFHKRSIQFITKMPEISPKVKIVGSFLEQALINLVANARDSFVDTEGRDYNSCSRRVEIIIKEEQEFVIIAITDNGCGMDPEVLEHCTDPFYSANLENSGIGLSMAKVVVETYGGNIKVGSIKGRGTAINISLPSATKISQSGESNAAA